MYFSGKNKKAPRFCLGALNLFFAERTGFLLIIRYLGLNLLRINTLKELSYDVLFIFSNVYILLSACKNSHFP